MTKYKAAKTGEVFDCNQSNFKAQGGEGSIYFVNNSKKQKVVCKICNTDKMIPDAKFRELSTLVHPKIIVPDDILLDNKNRHVGYTMKMVPNNPMPLARILTKTYREREGITPQIMADLVSQIRDTIYFIHKHDGYLQVDGNELNYMITDDYRDAYFIDVNSFQTPSFPADAIMPSIRDWHCPKDSNGWYKWSKETDWYSFSIISFFMFTGIHPFMGFNPKFTNAKTALKDQMLACVSVFDPETRFPKAAVYFPFDSVIPGGMDGAYMRWYKAIFVDNKRLPAPKDFQATIKFIAAKIEEISGSNNFKIELVKEYIGKLIGYYTNNGKDVVLTTDHLYVNNQPYQKNDSRFRICFTKNGTPVKASVENKFLKLENLDSKTEISCQPIHTEDIMSYNGRLYVLSSDDVFEVLFVDGKNIMALPRSIAKIMPHATEMWQGVVFQDMLGKKMASFFPQEQHHRMLLLEELSKIKITDAKFENNVLMVIGLEKESGRYDRYIFRFSNHWDSYDLRIIENITPSGLNFTVNEKGICVSITENEKVEIFSNQKDSSSLKSIDDPAINSNMKLCHIGNQIRIANGNKLYNISTN